MTAFLLRRIALIVPTLFFVSVLIFGLQQLLPGDPALALAGENQDPAVIAYLHQKYHLDRPLPVRYVLWVQGVLQGDLGESIRIKRPVFDLICEKLPVTGELALLALVVALAIGVPAGSSPRSGTTRRSIMGIDGRLVGPVYPQFLARHPSDPVVFGRIGAVAGLRLRRSRRQPQAEPADIGDAGLRARNAIAAVMMRHTRSAMLQVLSSDYVRTARAKGLGELRVILHHALRNALVPVVTLGALEFGQLLSGAVLTEQVFTIPGFGKLIVDAVFNRDYAVVQGVVLCTAMAYIALNLFADIAYVLINPRLRT